jgi:peptide/nickel transport system permease protein
VFASRAISLLLEEDDDAPEPPVPWGNFMAEGRVLFRVFPHNILVPGIFLALTVLAVNMLGDGLRDTLDPRLAKRVGN